MFNLSTYFRTRHPVFGAQFPARCSISLFVILSDFQSEFSKFRNLHSSTPKPSPMQNRRDWLKSTLSIAAGLPIVMSLSEQLMAAPVSEIERQQWGKFHAAGIKIKLNSNENPYGPSERRKRPLSKSSSREIAMPSMFRKK